MASSRTIYSMTGYGRGQRITSKRKLSAELKSVNNRFFEFQIKGIHLPGPVEKQILNTVKKTITRGTVTLFLNIVEYEPSATLPIVDINLAKAYQNLFKKTARHLGLKEQANASYLFTLPDVLRTHFEYQIDNRVIHDIQGALNNALREFNNMRKKEGQNLARDLKARTRRTMQIINRIEKKAPARIGGYKQRLESKLMNLFQTHLDESTRMRILTEVTVMADKMDISEEITRLKSHNLQFADALKKGGPLGKKLSFLLQEISREANTISSKAGNSKIVQACIEIKEETEKMREQVQNLE